MDPTTRPELFVLLAMIAPATVAGVILLVGALFRRGQPLAWIGALASGLAYLLGHFFALPAPPKFPPAASNDALYWAGALALFAGMMVGWRARSAWANALIVVIASCGSTYFVLQRVVGRMPSSEQVALFGGVALLAAVAFLGAERTAAKASGATAPLLLWCVATAAALSQALSGAATYASYTAVLAAALGAALVVAWIRRDVNYSRGLSVVVVAQLVVLCAAGVHVAELPRPAAGLLLLAPCGALLLGPGRAQSIGARKALSVRVALVLLPALAAVAWCAYERSQRVTSPYGY